MKPIIKFVEWESCEVLVVLVYIKNLSIFEGSDKSHLSSLYRCNPLLCIYQCDQMQLTMCGLYGEQKLEDKQYILCFVCTQTGICGSQSTEGRKCKPIATTVQLRVYQQL